MSELRAKQKVTISGPRGSREAVTVVGMTRTGYVIVEREDGEIDVVEREDVQS